MTPPGKDARERAARKAARKRDEAARHPPTAPPEPCAYCGSSDPPEVCCEASAASGMGGDLRPDPALVTLPIGHQARAP